MNINTEFNFNMAKLTSKDKNNILKDKFLAFLEMIVGMVLSLVAQLKQNGPDFSEVPSKLRAEHPTQAQVSRELTSLEAQLSDTESNHFADAAVQRPGAEAHLAKATLHSSHMGAQVAELTAKPDPDDPLLLSKYAALKAKNEELTQALAFSKQTSIEQGRELHRATREIVELKKELEAVSDRPPRDQWLKLSTDHLRAEHLLRQASEDVQKLSDRVTELKWERSAERERAYDLENRLLIMEDKWRRLQQHFQDQQDELIEAKQELQRARQFNRKLLDNILESPGSESPDQNLVQPSTQGLSQPPRLFGPEPTLSGAQTIAASLPAVPPAATDSFLSAPLPSVVPSSLPAHQVTIRGPNPDPHAAAASSSSSAAPTAATFHHAAQRTAAAPLHSPQQAGVSLPYAASQTVASSSHAVSQTAASFHPDVPQVAAQPPYAVPQSATALPHLDEPSGVSLKELDKIAHHIQRYEPKPDGSHDTSAYLRDIDFHLKRFPQATTEDRIYLIKVTSSRDVSSFIERQTAYVHRDYQALCQALSREFDDPDAHLGLLAALNIKQGRQESPQAYYSRLRKAYFGCRNEPDMEEEQHFKTLFVENLHPNTSRHLGVSACPRMLSSTQLRELASKGFAKQKKPPSKGTEPAIFEVTNRGPTLELEGVHQSDPGTGHRPLAKRPHRARPSPRGYPHGSQQHSYDNSRPPGGYNTLPRRETRAPRVKTDSHPRPNKASSIGQKSSSKEQPQTPSAESSGSPENNIIVTEEILEALRKLIKAKRSDPSL